MSPTLDRSIAGIEDEIGQLAGLPRKKLAQRWMKAFGAPTPKGIKRGLLERSCAFQLQARRFGGLKPATHKALLAIARGTSNERQAPRRELRQGTRLIREWNGVTYQVEVAETGFSWNGQTYSSLTAVARAITGAHWSGPRFFGL